jgi:hypothetical protein
LERHRSETDLGVDLSPALRLLEQVSRRADFCRRLKVIMVEVVDLFGVPGEERHALEARRRPESVAIHYPIHGTAWIRDNKPINEPVLRRILEGMTAEQFYRSLNSQVFFWVSIDRLHRLRKAPPYRTAANILEFDTAALLERHHDHVELSHLNSGAVHPAANYPRRREDLRTHRTYRYGERKLVSSEPVVELTVLYPVPDARDFIVNVTTL